VERGELESRGSELRGGDRVSEKTPTCVRREKFWPHRRVRLFCGAIPHCDPKLKKSATRVLFLTAPADAKNPKASGD
jgi:hypothetical protein